MILQPGILERTFDSPEAMADVVALARAGIPPMIYLPSAVRGRRERWAKIREIAFEAGCGVGVYCNGGSGWLPGNDPETGRLKSPVGNDELWRMEKQWWIKELGDVAIALWGSILPERRDPPIVAVVWEHEWRKRAKVVPAQYWVTADSPLTVRQAVDERWTEYLNAMSVLGPGLRVFGYARGTSPCWWGGEALQGNTIDVGKNMYRVGQYGLGSLDSAVRHLNNAQKAQTPVVSPPPDRTAWVTLGLGYDSLGVWRDDGPEIFRSALSYAMGRKLRISGIEHAMLYRVATPHHWSAFVSGFLGTARGPAR